MHGGERGMLGACSGLFGQAHMRTPGSTPTANGAAPRILLAEDDRELRCLLVSILRQHGCRIVEAANGSELLDRIAGELHFMDDLGFDVVVSDVCMPGSNGLEVLGGLRSARLRVPVVLISAFANAETRYIARELGAQLLDKPFDLETFAAVVLAAVERGRRGHQRVDHRGVG
jgi:DNA-binding response OmpR family regulator